MNWLMDHIIECVLGVTATLIVLMFAIELWASRGRASDEEITAHRLREHHHFPGAP